MISLTRLETEIYKILLVTISIFLISDFENLVISVISNFRRSVRDLATVGDPLLESNDNKRT